MKWRNIESLQDLAIRGTALTLLLALVGSVFINLF